MPKNTPGEFVNLSQISTDPRVRNWIAADGEFGAGVIEEGRRQFFERYSLAVYMYVKSILREPQGTHEVVQQFAVRVLDRSFRGYTPERGRFRDYLKAILRNMVIDFWRVQQLASRQAMLVSPKVLAQLPEPTGIDTALDGGQEELEALIEIVLGKLSVEQGGRRPSFADVLIHVMQNPEHTSEAAAAALTLALQLESPLTGVAFRQMLHRARKRFSQMFIEQLAIPPGMDYKERLKDRLDELGISHLVNPPINY